MQFVWNLLRTPYNREITGQKLVGLGIVIAVIPTVIWKSPVTLVAGLIVAIVGAVLMGWDD